MSLNRGLALGSLGLRRHLLRFPSLDRRLWGGSLDRLSLVFADDFESATLSPEWEPVDGEWVVTEAYGRRCVAQVTVPDFRGLLVYRGEVRDGVVDVLVHTHTYYVGVVFRYVDPDNFYLLVHSAGLKVLRLQKRLNGVWGDRWDVPLEYSGWFRLTVRFEGGRVVCWFNGVRTHDVTGFTELPTGRVALFTDHVANFYFDNFLLYEMT